MTPHELVETRRRQSAGEPKVAFSQEEAERIERALAQAAALRTRLEEAVKALEPFAAVAKTMVAAGWKHGRKLEIIDAVDGGGEMTAGDFLDLLTALSPGAGEQTEEGR